jgi:biopolymer transport protein ExbB
MMNSVMPVLAQDADAETATTWLDMMGSGGPIGYIIIALSIGALALIVMHFIQIRRAALIPAHQLEELDGLLSGGDVQSALEYCLDPDSDSYLTRILAPALTRFQKSAFGVFEIKNAIEEAGEEQTARLYRSTDALGVIGGIAPLLGLLGTVLGMIGAFGSLSRSAGSGNYEELASSISLALVTTFMGLTLAIPCIALFTFFRNRIDAFGSEAAMEIEQLTLHLESGTGQTAPAASSMAAPRGGVKPEPRKGAPAGGGAPT